MPRQWKPNPITLSAVERAFNEAIRRRLPPSKGLRMMLVAAVSSEGVVPETLYRQHVENLASVLLLPAGDPRAEEVLISSRDTYYSNFRLPLPPALDPIHGPGSP